MRAIGRAVDDARPAIVHHGANIVRVAGPLRGLTLTSGNRRPAPADRTARARAESDRLLDRRLPHPADPSHGH